MKKYMILVVLLVVLLVSVSAVGVVSASGEDNGIQVSVSAAKLAKGDKQYVDGFATGNPTTVWIWIFGKNYRNLWNAESVASDGSFDYDGLGRAETVNLAAGEYFLVVQHPMMNGIADIEGGALRRAPPEPRSITRRTAPAPVSGSQSIVFRHPTRLQLSSTH